MVRLITKSARVMVVVMLLSVISTAQPPAHPHKRFVSKAELKLNQDMRKLWEDHIIWTRNVICNILDNLPGTNEAVGRLLQNQTDIGDAFKPYFGNAAGNTLTGLLNGHIVTAASLLTALNNNDATGIATASAAWYANGDSIAQFLHSINPNIWGYQEMLDMFNEHLDLTVIEAVARHTGDYAGDVAAFDSVHVAILEMADMLTAGIVRRFHQQFHRPAQLITLDEEISLGQNSPNPFRDETSIEYYIPENTGEAVISIADNSGKVIRTVPVENYGEGMITIYASALRSGTYIYSIIADGKLIDTKTMVHQ